MPCAKGANPVEEPDTYHSPYPSARGVLGEEGSSRLAAAEAKDEGNVAGMMMCECLAIPLANAGDAAVRAGGL